MRTFYQTVSFGQSATAESLVLLALACWWWSSTVLPATVLPSPQAVFGRLVEIASTPGQAWHALVTSLRVLASVVLGLALGFLLALVAHSLPSLSGIIMDRVLVVLNGMPSVGWALLA